MVVLSLRISQPFLTFFVLLHKLLYLSLAFSLVVFSLLIVQLKLLFFLFICLFKQLRV